MQVARWDGNHIDQTYVNARTAALLSLIGLSMLENGYIETNFGPVIMVFGGNGFIANIPGHKFDVQTRAAGAGSLHKPSQKHKRFIKSKKHFINYHTPEFDGNDFYIQGSKHITVKSKPIKHAVKSEAVSKQLHKVANEAYKSISSSDGATGFSRECLRHSSAIWVIIVMKQHMAPCSL